MNMILSCAHFYLKDFISVLIFFYIMLDRYLTILIRMTHFNELSRNVPLH